MFAMSAKPNSRGLTSIVAIDLHGAIGCDNTLPWRLKSDMAFFREQTIGNTVIMGRKTYNSIGSKPLPRRNNIVLSHNTVLFEAEPACQLALSVGEALYRADKNADEEAFVIGGAQTYEQFDSLVDRYLVTIVDHKVPKADAFLSERLLQSLCEWNRVELASFQASSDQDEFDFSIYEISAPNIEARRLDRQRLIEGYAEKVSARKGRSANSRAVLPISQDAFAF
jgi:dihydrofolate reductase